MGKGRQSARSGEDRPAPAPLAPETPLQSSFPLSAHAEREGCHFEAASAVESPEEPRGQEGAAEADQNGWKQVPTRRRHTARDRDARSVVIWGVPTDLPYLTLRRVFRDNTHSVQHKLLDVAIEDLHWISADGLRLVQVTFFTLIERESKFAAMQAICKKQGWKALKSRPYSCRAKSRSEPRPLQTHNRYLALPVPSETISERTARADSLDSKLWSRLKIGSLNIGGDLNRKIAELEEHLSQGEYDVVALQEVRKVNSLNVKGYKYFAHTQASGYGGVGFLVALHVAPLVQRLAPKAPHSLWLQLKGTAGKKDLYICSAYMPQESAPVKERNSNWTQLEAEVARYQCDGEVVIAGDLNAKIGSPSSDRERRASRCTKGHHSSNGQRLLNLLMRRGLVTLGGHSQPQSQDQWYTRLDPRSGRETQIDHVIVSARHFKLHRSQFQVDYTNLDTDHHLLAAFVYCPRKISKRKRARKFTRFLVEKLRAHSRKEKEGKDRISQAQAITPGGQYRAALETAFKLYNPGDIAANLTENKTAGVVSDFISRINEALHTSVGTKTVSKSFSRSWFDEDVKEAIARRRDAYATFKATRNKSDWNGYRATRKSSRNLIREKKREEWEKVVSSIDLDRSINPKRMWATIRRLIGGRKSRTSTPVLQQDGGLAVSEADRREAWSAHLEQLGQSSDDPAFDSAFKKSVELEVQRMAEQSSQFSVSEQDADFTEEEVSLALEHLKYYKAAGKDQIRNEPLKEGGAGLISALTMLFNWINSVEEVPADWAEAVVVFLHKDGDETDPGNYRGISLISCLGKLYLGLWNSRLTRHLEANGHLAEEQGGFRAGRSTTDQVYTLHEALLHRRREGKPTYCCFIDFRKAFDTVWHAGLWKKLWNADFRGKGWRILRNLYSKYSEHPCW